MITNLPNINTTDGSTVEHRVYSNGKNGSSVELYKVIGGGHTWPGSAVSLPATNKDFNASKEIWRFFNKFSLDKMTTIDPVSSTLPEVQLFPNPSSTDVEVRISTSLPYTIQLFNGIGQQVYANTSENGVVRILRSDLPAGVYLVHIQSENFSICKKIIFH